MFHYIIKPLVVLPSTLQKSNIFSLLANGVVTELCMGKLKPTHFLGNVTVSSLLLLFVTHSYLLSMVDLKVFRWETQQMRGMHYPPESSAGAIDVSLDTKWH